ncbi:activity-regulated cytoskeleton associated protein 2-like [Eupeodes corollae]|uniref:activity-regulated cytoskeleton associated protein 2-like n=1 Tax=Eupeodes corollae TaxID=290404 RepID=UPI002492A9A7|nr:activity-regulated cytoskeleton associated protein 2-like [Eupeodes corollae]
MEDEQFQQLIDAINIAVKENYDKTAALSVQNYFQPKKSFANCRSSFEGTCDKKYVEEFLISIELFKSVEQITDEDALHGICFLFRGLAATWWKGIKKEAKTWNEAIELIRNNFAPTKPNYQIYMDIFQTSQGAYTTIDNFVCEKLSFLAQLPKNCHHTLETEIDFIYGLLHVNYKKNIAREDVKTFRDLLEKGRAIEDINNELKDPCTKCHLSGHTMKSCHKIYSDENDSDIFTVYE